MDTETRLRDEVLTLEDGRSLRWCEFGDPGGRPLIYCHGLPGSRLEGRLMEASAVEAGLRVLAPDRPGYGGSCPRPGRWLGDEVDDVRRLLDHLELPVVDVLGFSGGGPHALACAARMSDRVDRLGLVASCAPFAETGREGMADGFDQLWALAETDFPAFEAALAQALDEAGSAYAMMVDGAPQRDRAILEQPEVAPDYETDLEVARAQGEDGLLEDASAMVAPWAFDVEAVSCPTWLWHGQQDRTVPIHMGRWIAEQLPAATLTEWPNASHFEVFRRWPEVLAVHAMD